MTWETLLPLIAQYGLPWAYNFWQIVTQHPQVTDEAWQKLLAIATKPMEVYINEARARAGLPPLPLPMTPLAPPPGIFPPGSSPYAVNPLSPP